MDKTKTDSERFFKTLVKKCNKNGIINQNLYQEYDVKRGLRESNGNGVLTGLTEISDVMGYKFVNGVKEPADGNLYYRGYSVSDLVKGPVSTKYKFEEATYLLLFGTLPTSEELKSFVEVLSEKRTLTGQFVRDVIMKKPSQNLMNGLQKSVLSLYSYDENPDNISVENVLNQSLGLIAQMPLLSVYSYYAHRHFNCQDSLIIKTPKADYSAAENLLYILRPNGEFSELEASVLDNVLVLHAEHGGGNNSTFTNHVVTSSGTDTYSAVAASISSLKGPKHGGANLKVQAMFEDIRKHVKDTKDKDALKEYLQKILDKETFDKMGLIYGIGHPVYTISDPREVILKKGAKSLSKEKGLEDEFEFYETVEKISTRLVSKHRHVVKPVCANVDFYSGFIFTMLGIPQELFTPMFAMGRISGWSAHRLEEIINNGKIIRPAYKFVGKHLDYVPRENR